jgi:RNA polymerase sigma-70 factor (ECF subfamily)
LLIEQSAQSNTNAFRLLVLRYQRMIFSYLRNFLLPVQVLEDLAQETFMRAYRDITNFDSENWWFLSIPETRTCILLKGSSAFQGMKLN